MRLSRLAAPLAAASVALSVGGAVPAAAQIDLARLEGIAARSIGPAGMSGRIGAIDAVAANPNVIYVGAATGGLWKSTSGGATWVPIMDSLRAASIGAVAINQANPDVVWIGTGEKARRNSSGVGTGVYKTLDGGRTWRFLGLEETTAVAEIILHPHDEDVAYVAALGNTWREGADRGVYKTTDGGGTWTRVLYVDERTGAADLVMDPSNPNRLLAAMWEHRRWPWFFRSGGPGSGLHLTVDGGATWTKLTADDGLPRGELGRIGLDFARSNPDVVYALVEATRSVLLRSDDGGRTWRTVNRERGIANRPFYYAQVRVDPDNENRVYNVFSLVDVSDDGGRTFRTLLPFARVHPDHHAFWVNPLDGRILIDGNDGGVAVSRDRGQGWRFVENLPLAQFYHINVDMETPFNVYGGLQDNGSWKGPSAVWENGGIRSYHWEEVAFGDGFATVSDPNTPRYGYAMSQGGNLIRFDKVTGERKSIRPGHPDGVPLRFNWNAAIAVDPFDGSIYYGSQFVHHSRDMGSSWSLISPDLTTNDPEKQRQIESGGLTYDVTAAENHTTIITIAPSPVERGVLWAGTDDGNVQVTRDGGRTWVNVADRIRGVPRATWVPHIEPSTFDGGTAFVVFDDHRRGNDAPYVYRTTDYGISWTSLVTPDLDAFVHVIEQDPVTPSLLYLGTEHGMFVSFDGGTQWSLWRHGVPRAPVRALIVHPRDHDLVIGTHGRAAYVLDDVRPLRAIAADPGLQHAPLHLFEIPPTIQYHVKQVGGYRFLADAIFVGDNRAYGALLTYAIGSEGEADDAAEGAAGGQGPKDRMVKIEVLDAAGEVIRTFEGPAKTGINRTAWNLRRDGVRGPRNPDDEPGEILPPGPDALPGDYTIRLSLGDQQATGAVTVAPDPRFTIPRADRERKHAVELQAMRRRAVGAEAVNRIRDTRQAVDDVLERIEDRTDGLGDSARTAADSLKQRLTELEEAFVGPQDLQGIVRRPDAALSLIGSAANALGSSWEAPTETQLLYLRQAEERLREALDRVNDLFGSAVVAFRTLVDRLNLERIPTFETLEMN